MISQIFSSPWSGAVANHLWQSTLFAAIAALLTLALRKNHARSRYWLWMVASVKFLIPFSWLVALGSQMSWSHEPAASAGAYMMIEEVSQPFTHTALPVAPIAPADPSAFLHLLPAVLVAVWLCGFVAVVLTWIVRWRQISATLRTATPMRAGREVDALRRIERASGLRTRVELLLSRSMLEPGIFGMTRPVLVWPDGISERLENQHLEAILAHELWHVRRRDNLAAALHMLVEAVFWFHPLVWWLGTRLIDERERACDEDVLEFGSDRHVYAESILKVCEFCVGSPLACVSGVTGADLKKRMVHIMSESVVRKLGFGRKLLLGAVGTLAIAVPIIFGLARATPSQARSQDVAQPTATAQFGSVSIKPTAQSTDDAPGNNPRQMVRMMFGPDGYRANGVTMRSLIQEAYGVQANQVLGPPEFLDTIDYDVEAKINHAAELKEQGPETIHQQLKHMLQGMLADRAKLVLHNETRDLPNYVLSVSEGGVKLQPAQADKNAATIAAGGTMSVGQMVGRQKIEAEGRATERRGIFMQQTNDGSARVIASQGCSMENIAEQFSMLLGVNVLDKTGLHGNYDFTLQWQDSSSPESLISAVQEQLGLKLQQVTMPTQVLIIDHVQRPEEVTSARR